MDIEEIEKAIKERKEAAENGNMSLVAQIEGELQLKGIDLFETPLGTYWKKKDI